MTVRARVVIALVAVLVPVLGGCGSASVSSPPSGIDELTIPTPSPDPGDFVAGVDNPWLPLPAGRTWTYDVVDVVGGHRLTVAVAPGPEVEGVATTARVSTESGTSTTDWFAQDADGNVWWFGREGEWTAGADGAEAGLAMPADPRVGDGYRLALQEGVVEDVATVTSLRGSATVPAGSYDDLLVTEVTSDLGASGPTEQYWSRGLGLVEEQRPGRTVRLSDVSG
ncbi:MULTISPECIES: hypothetical protein [unclassified Nocardioides]|uniref:hypothetical protein n=1 Tax=unclassified Nocardioides TaxID=2615069 RepID=UPI0012E350EC|nr:MULTISPECIES: hypothetical protein [unclassified Nocardioides]